MTNSNTIPEKADRSQEPNEPRTVARELNFDFGQLFYPREKGKKIFDIRCFKRVSGDQEISAIIKPDATLGTITTFDERVFYALVEIWSEQGKPEICFFSEREIARRINLGWGKCTAKAIDDSLNRLRLVGIQWQGSFFDSVKKKLIEIRNPFTILNHLRIISTKDEGVGSQIAEFGFDKRVIQNLNSNYSRPVRFDVILSFHLPLAQAMYTLSEPKLFGAKQYHRKTKGLVEDLGLIGESYQRKAIRVQEFGKLQKELIGKPTGFGEVIERYEIVSGKDDAVVEIGRSGAGRRIKGKKVEVPKTEHSEPSQKPAKSQSKASSSTENSTAGHTEAQEVLQYFAKVFYNREQTNFNKSAISKAQEIVSKYGMERAKKFIKFAEFEANKTNYKPKHFNGILQYLEPAIEEFNSQQRIARRQEDEATRRRLENERYDHKTRNEYSYFEYISELIESFQDDVNMAGKFTDFRCWQAEKREESEQIEREWLREKALKIFDSEESGIARIVEFFKNDPDIHIPDFWEWDEKVNPHLLK